MAHITKEEKKTRFIEKNNNNKYILYKREWFEVNYRGRLSVCFSVCLSHVSQCTHDDQMLTFTVEGFESTSPSSTACPEIGCCWGVGGSHPFMPSTCSRTHLMMSQATFSRVSTITQTHTHTRRHTLSTKHKGDVVTDAPVTYLASTSNLHLQNSSTADRDLAVAAWKFSL